MVNLDINMAKPKFDRNCGGHRSGPIIDGQPRDERIDQRVAHRNRLRRATITYRCADGKRRRGCLTSDGNIPGTRYDSNLQCTKCKLYKSKKCFTNKSVALHTRKKTGFNIQCRSCQRTKYKHGYKIDDFVVSGSDNGSDYEDDEDDDDDPDYDPSSEDE